jgi:hypothetical protein
MNIVVESRLETDAGVSPKTRNQVRRTECYLTEENSGTLSFET